MLSFCNNINRFINCVLLYSIYYILYRSCVIFCIFNKIERIGMNGRNVSKISDQFHFGFPEYSFNLKQSCLKMFLCIGFLLSFEFNLFFATVLIIEIVWAKQWASLYCILSFILDCANVHNFLRIVSRSVKCFAKQTNNNKSVKRNKTRVKVETAMKSTPHFVYFLIFFSFVCYLFSIISFPFLHSFAIYKEHCIWSVRLKFVCVDVDVILPIHLDLFSSSNQPHCLLI